MDVHPRELIEQGIHWLATVLSGGVLIAAMLVATYDHGSTGGVIVQLLVATAGFAGTFLGQRRDAWALTAAGLVLAGLWWPVASALLG